MTSAVRAIAAPEVSELVSRARSGDDAAFEQLYREHAGRVYALCLRLSGDAVRARELTQDVFVRVWERLDSYRGESAFSSWLHRLAVNVALMAHRGDARRLRRVEPTNSVDDAAAQSDAGSPGADIDLERAIAKLPEGARTVFVLHDVEGYRHDEIAAMTGTAPGTCRAQLFRARRLLREMLER